MSKWVIETQGLSRHFGQKAAVREIDLQITRGEVFGFLGPNGAGKTTTVRLLNGVLASTGGWARVLGMDPIQEGSQVRRRTGVLTETPALYEQLTALENLNLFGALYDVDPATLSSRSGDLLKLMGLEGRQNDRVGGYSKGMKQRLAIARALLHAPDMLFLDEPTSGLDPAAARQVTEMIERLSEQEGRTIFLCTHNLVEAQRLCDRVGVITAGQLIAVGTPAELARQLWRDTWVDIELTAPTDSSILVTLRSQPGVVEVHVNGSLLTLHLADGDQIPGIVSALVYANARVMRVVPKEHTLEDIYFQLQDNS